MTTRRTAILQLAAGAALATFGGPAMPVALLAPPTAADPTDLAALGARLVLVDGYDDVTTAAVIRGSAGTAVYLPCHLHRTERGRRILAEVVNQLRAETGAPPSAA